MTTSAPPWSRRRWLGALASVPAFACGDRSRPREQGPAAPRVASQTVLSDEVLWDLGEAARDRVVAVSTMADDARYSRVAGQWPPSLPRAAGSSEALIALRPTLVIVASFTAADTLRLIEQAGLTALVLDRFDGFDDYRENVRAIASAIEQAAAGEQLVAKFDRRADTLRRPVKPDAPRVVSWNEGSVPGADTSFDELATLVGYHNLPASEGKRGHLQVTLEQLVAWNPDVIVIPGETDDDAKTAAAFAARPGIAATSAARRGQIITVRSRDLYSVGAGMLDVAQRLKDALPR